MSLLAKSAQSNQRHHQQPDLEVRRPGNGVDQGHMGGDEVVNCWCQIGRTFQTERDSHYRFESLSTLAEPALVMSLFAAKRTKVSIVCCLARSLAESEVIGTLAWKKIVVRAKDRVYRG